MGQGLRKKRWIISINVRNDKFELHLSVDSVEEMLAALDVTVSDIEQAMDGSSLQIYAVATEGNIREYAKRLRQRYDGDSFTVELSSEKREKASRCRKRPTPGDVFAVPLPEAHYGYVRMLQEVPEYGPSAQAIEYLDITTVGALATIEECGEAPIFLEPTITNIRLGVSQLGWKEIGKIARESTPLRFRSSLMSFLTGSELQTDWRVLEPGKGWIRCGILPESYRALPESGFNPPVVMTERIAAAKGIAQDIQRQLGKHVAEK